MEQIIHINAERHAQKTARKKRLIATKLRNIMITHHDKIIYQNDKIEQSLPSLIDAESYVSLAILQITHNTRYHREST